MTNSGRPFRPAHAYTRPPTRQATGAVLALIEKYVRHVGTSEYSPLAGQQFNDGDGRLAIAKCNAGDTATGIPILERRLRAAKIDLPPRV